MGEGLDVCHAPPRQPTTQTDDNAPRRPHPRAMRASLFNSRSDSCSTRFCTRTVMTNPSPSGATRALPVHPARDARFTNAWTTSRTSVKVDILPLLALNKQLNNGRRRASKTATPRPLRA